MMHQIDYAEELVEKTYHSGLSYQGAFLRELTPWGKPTRITHYVDVDPLVIRAFPEACANVKGLAASDRAQREVVLKMLGTTDCPNYPATFYRVDPRALTVPLSWSGSCGHSDQYGMHGGYRMQVGEWNTGIMTGGTAIVTGECLNAMAAGTAGYEIIQRGGYTNYLEGKAPTPYPFEMRQVRKWRLLGVTLAVSVDDPVLQTVVRVGEMGAVGTVLRIGGGGDAQYSVSWRRTHLNEYDPVVTINGKTVAEGEAYAVRAAEIPIAWQFRPSTPGEFNDNYTFTVRLD